MDHKLIVAGVIFAALALWFLNRKKDNFQKLKQPTGSKKALVLIYGRGCHHCHDMMPAWEKVSEILKDKMDVIKIEENNPETFNHPNVTKLPTIRLLPKGISNPVPYISHDSSDRSVESLLKFAEK